MIVRVPPWSTLISPLKFNGNFKKMTVKKKSFFKTNFWEGVSATDLFGGSSSIVMLIFRKILRADFEIWRPEV